MGRLLVVGLNPPETSGLRTLQRIELARRLLGYETVDIRNLFASPTRSAVQLAAIGSQPQGWLMARADLADELAHADGVLLAYGVRAPGGPARRHFEEQVSWLDGVLNRAGLPVWLVGGAPRHPSRWQRYTHRSAPDKAFPDALRGALAARGSAAFSD